MAKKDKNSKASVGNNTHVTLTKYPTRMMFTLIITSSLTVLFTAWIWAGIRKGNLPWVALGAPMIFIGLLTLFLQPEEEWNYTPWQESTQKYEKNIYD